MFKIDSPFATPDNEFQGPDAISGDPGTRVSYEWLNAVQRELIGVLEEAGVTPSKADDGQLTEAINALIAAGGGGGGGGGSPHWVAPVATTAALIPGSLNGAVALTLDNKRLYYSNGTTWFLLYDKGDFTTLTTLANTKIPLTQKGAPSGVAPLNASSKIDPVYMSGVVPNVIEATNLASFPVSGVPATIYVALDTNKQYRWGGSVYVELVASPGTTDSVSEGSVNKYYTDARAQASAETVLATQKGAASGLAPLNSSSKIDSGYLPSYVDDVLDVANFAALPASGDTGKIYITTDNNKQYRWSGSVYIELVSSPGTTDAITEGITNKFFTDERAQDAIGSALENTSTINLTYNDATGKFTADLNPGVSGGLSPVPLVTASGTSVINTAEPVNPVGTGGITRTLPASTTQGWSIIIYDVSGACSPTDFIRITPGAGDSLYIPGIGLTTDSLKLRRANVRVSLNQAPGSTAVYVELQGYSGASGGLVPVDQAASLSPAVTNKMYKYGTLAAPLTLTLPTGTTQFVIGVIGSASLTNTLTVVGPTDSYVFRYPNFSAVFYRAAGSSVIGVDYQAATLGPPPGMVPGYTGGVAIAAGMIGERIDSLISNVAYTDLAGTPKTVATLPITAGVWMAYATVSAALGGTTTNYMDGSISTVNNVPRDKGIGRYNANGTSVAARITAPPLYINTTGQTLYLVSQMGGTGTVPSTIAANMEFFAIRIA